MIVLSGGLCRAYGNFGYAKVQYQCTLSLSSMTLLLAVNSPLFDLLLSWSIQHPGFSAIAMLVYLIRFRMTLLFASTIFLKFALIQVTLKECFVCLLVCLFVCLFVCLYRTKMPNGIWYLAQVGTPCMFAPSFPSPDFLKDSFFLCNFPEIPQVDVYGLIILDETMKRSWIVSMKIRLYMIDYSKDPIFTKKYSLSCHPFSCNSIFPAWNVSACTMWCSIIRRVFFSFPEWANL